MKTYEDIKRAHIWKLGQARRDLLPLRRRVNSALMKAKLPHARWYPSGRIRGMSHVTFGWETETDIIDGVIRVRFWGGHEYDRQRLPELKSKAREALKEFTNKEIRIED